MIELNNLNFRTTLKNIYKIDEKYIALKQGNWYNPQQQKDKPTTWIAYNVLRNTPVTLPYYRDEEIDGVVNNYVEVTKIAEIDLQFIGLRSEELANNVSTWLKRNDVKLELEEYSGQLMAKDYSAWSSDYIINNASAIKAWNVKIYICWVSQTITEQILFESVTVEGGING